MSSYSDCPISDNGIHKIVYNRYTGKALCVSCGYILMQTKVTEQNKQIAENNPKLVKAIAYKVRSNIK